MLPVATWLLFGLALFGVFALLVALVCLRRVERRPTPEPQRYPSFSILKPLAGLDDELLENLESHLELDYPGEYEILLGVRSEQDLAYPIARDFAAAHPDKVRLVMQQGEPGHNPKVNQLITLTRAARHELIAMTDSNIRVAKSYLREHASLLADPNVGLTSNLFIGVGERRLGAVLDNQIIAAFCAPMIASGDVVMRLDQVVGKSLATRREVLDEVGGWHEVKDVLAEDNRLSQALRKIGLHSRLCPTPVQNVQRDQPFSYVWHRHTRWAMIRFRVLIPGVLLEPLLMPVLFALAGALVAYRSAFAWAFVGAIVLFDMVYTQLAAKLARGHGFKPLQLLWAPFRNLVFFATWLRGATMRRVNWRGNWLYVLARTRLAEPEVLERAKKIQRLGR